MGKKRKRDKTDKPNKAEKFQVRPFEELKSIKKELEKKPSGSSAPPPQSSPPPPAVEKKASGEKNIFAKEMADVTPLDDRPRVTPKQNSGHRKAIDEVQAIDAYLRDLVDGVVPFDIADTDEYIEGSVHGLDHHLVRKLRRGEYAVQEHLDLHGLNREEARKEVAKFIKASQKRGLRCVLIVHGRGFHSKDQIPVLKEKIKSWLTRGSIGTLVLAFTSARQYDGGTGAVYVLLRR